MTAPDGNLRNAAVTVSVLNPQTNTYTTVGKTYVIATRKSGTILICILGRDRQPMAAVPATPTIEWSIQSDNYCSFLDTRKARFLLLFETAAEARVFTAMALSAKLAQSTEPIPIVSADGGGQIPKGDRFTVSYVCYDLNQPKVDNPIMDEHNFSVGMADETPLRAVAGRPSGVYLVAYPRGVVAIVEAAGEVKELPSFGDAAKGEVEAPKEEKEKKVRRKRGKGKSRGKGRAAASDDPLADQVDDPLSVPEPTQTNPRVEEAPQIATPKEEPKKRRSEPKEEPKKMRQSEQKQEQTETSAPKPKPAPKKKVVKMPEAKPVPMYDAQLESIRDEMQEKFSELSHMVASLRRTQTIQNNAALASDVLVSSAQRLLKENQAKDQLITEKQQLIDLLNERHTDTRERDTMRVQVSELNSKLANQRQLTREKGEQQKGLNAQIEELQAQIIKSRVEAESRLNVLHQQLEEEKQRQLEEVNQARTQLRRDVTASEEELASVREKFTTAQSQNKTLKTQATRDMTGELKTMRAAVPALVQRTVKQMVSGVYEMIEQNFDEDSEYNGVAIIKAIRVALQTQANDVAEQIDPDDD